MYSAFLNWVSCGIKGPSIKPQGFLFSFAPTRASIICLHIYLWPITRTLRETHSVSPQESLFTGYGLGASKSRRAWLARAQRTPRASRSPAKRWKVTLVLQAESQWMFSKCGSYKKCSRFSELVSRAFPNHFSVQIQDGGHPEDVTCLNVMRSTCRIWRWPKQFVKVVILPSSILTILWPSNIKETLSKGKQKALYMVDAKIFMAAERNGYNGQIFEALRNRFPEIPEQVISQTLQAEVSFVLISNFIFVSCLRDLFVLFLEWFKKRYFRIWCRSFWFFYHFLIYFRRTNVGCIFGGVVL